MQITIAFNNFYAINKNSALIPDWGFSALIKSATNLILFDTGSNGSILLNNLRYLGVSISDISHVVISHNHWDHTGGIIDLIEANPSIKILAPALDKALIENLHRLGATISLIEESEEITPQIHTTSAFKGQIHELGLILKTKRGNILLTGCAHPGIVTMINKVPLPRLAAIGGFHLFTSSAQEIVKISKDLLKTKVQLVSPSHCTGEHVIEYFKLFFKDSYLYGGLGAKFTF